MMNRNYQIDDIDAQEIDDELRNYEDELFMQVIFNINNIYISTYI